MLPLQHGELVKSTIVKKHMHVHVVDIAKQFQKTVIGTGE